MDVGIVNDGRLFCNKNKRLLQEVEFSENGLHVCLDAMLVVTTKEE
jgi:hypothetical protein